MRAYWDEGGGGSLRSEAHEVRGPDGTWRMDGPFRSWHADGSREAEGSYVDDLQSGPWTTWYPDGALQSRGSYLFGEKEGVWVHRAPDGALDEELTGMYEAGKRLAAFHVDGPQTEWFAKDQPRERSEYVDGLRHGAATTWYPSGKKRSEGAYEAGRKVGTWTYWREDGSVDPALSGFAGSGRKSP